MKGRSVFVALAVSFWCLSAPAAIWYVDDSNGGVQNGGSWATAYRTIQPAIDAASSGDEVWVAAGTYNETRTANASGSVVMKNGVAIYGGFAGTEEFDEFSLRRYKTNLTIIDGSNGRGAALKAYHVVLGADNAILDGFIVQNGDANGAALIDKKGGGMLNDGVSPTVRNCTFRTNRADAVAGAMLCSTSSSILDAVIFHNNTANGIGTGDGGGGALCLDTGGTPIVTNCLFYSNSVSGTSPATGGGAVMVAAQNPVIKNCTFSLNTSPPAASGEGGGSAIIVTNNGNPTITNCIMWGDIGAEIALSTLNSGNATVSFCTVQGGFVGGTNILTTDPLFVSPGLFNFKLQSTSPAKDSGTSTGAPAKDLLGTNRPLDAGVDRGAYEFDETLPNAQCIDFLTFLNNSGQATITVNDINNGSSDAGGIESLTLSQTLLTCADLGSGTDVILTVTDFAGNSDSCISDITVSDPFPPEITTCANNIFAPVNGSCQAVVPDFTTATIATDNCTIASRSQSPVAGSLISNPEEVTITITDSSGQMVTCTAFAIPTDLAAPDFDVCPAPRTVFVDNGCQVAIPNLVPEATATDNCGGAVTITQSPAAGTLVGTTTVVTLTAEDTALNQNSSCTVIVTVQDNEDPVITTCPADAVVPADGSCSGVIPDLVSAAAATDNCGAPTITQSPLAGVAISQPVTVVTITATDGSGNTDTCAVNVTLQDSTDPQILACASDTTASIGVGCEATIPDLTGGVTASDNCVNFTVTQSPLSGTVVSADTVVTLTVTDDAGNDVTCTATVFIDDTTAPTVTQCAPNTTIDLNASCEGVVPDLTAQVSATDNCGIASVTQSPLAGSTITTATIVTFTITDTAANTSTCTANLSVQDVTGPTITTCAVDQNVLLGPGCQTTLPDFTAGVIATDNCPGSVTITQSPIAGATITGTTTVTITAADGLGNLSTCTAQAIASDGAAPVINTCATDDTLDLNANCEVAIPDLTGDVSATDDCAVTVTQSPLAGTLVSVDTVVTLTATDSGGLFSTCTATIFVQDVTGPVITRNGAATIIVPVGGTYTELGATAVDNCDTVAPAVTISGGPVLTGSPNTYNLLYSASDSQSNAGTPATRTVIVTNDSTPPTITLQGPSPVSVNCGAGYTDPGATAVDNLDGDITGDIVVTGGPILPTTPPGPVVLTYTVTDSSGNTAQRTRTVTVLNNCSLDIHVVGSTTVDRAENDSVTFTVVVTGAVGTAELQWEVEVAPNNWQPISGEDGLTYTIANISASDFGRYRCTATDDISSDVSEIITLRDVNAVPAVGLLGLAGLAFATALGGAAGLRRRKK